MNNLGINGGVRTGKRQGFTLIELLVAVAIVGIIAAIAIPSYGAYVINSRRAAAQSFLLQIVLREEEFFSSNRAYTTTIGTGGLGLTAPPETSGYYTFSATTTATSYIIAAARAGSQLNDAVGDVKINSAGEKCTHDAVDKKWGNSTSFASGTC